MINQLLGSYETENFAELVLFVHDIMSILDGGSESWTQTDKFEHYGFRKAFDDSGGSRKGSGGSLDLPFPFLKYPMTMK